MIVFGVFESVDYEGDRLLKVFSNKEKAEVFRKEQDEECSWRSGVDYVVEELEVE